MKTREEWSNPVVQSPSSEASSRSPGQEIRCLVSSRRFIAGFTGSHHRTLSWVGWIKFTPSLHVSTISIIIFWHLHLVSQVGSFLQVFWLKCTPFFLHYAFYMSHLSHLLYLTTLIILQIMTASHCVIFSILLLLLCFISNILPSTLFWTPHGFQVIEYYIHSSTLA
jgi:hypothetical protein